MLLILHVAVTCTTVPATQNFCSQPEALWLPAVWDPVQLLCSHCTDQLTRHDLGAQTELKHDCFFPRDNLNNNFNKINFKQGKVLKNVDTKEKGRKDAKNMVCLFHSDVPFYLNHIISQSKAKNTVSHNM